MNLNAAVAKNIVNVLTINQGIDIQQSNLNNNNSSKDSSNVSG